MKRIVCCPKCKNEDLDLVPDLINGQVLFCNKCSEKIAMSNLSFKDYKNKETNFEQWIVYDNEEGLVLLINDYEEALAKYEKCKKDCKDNVSNNGEFSSNETVVLAKVDKFFYSKAEYIGEYLKEVWEFKEESIY